jgi:hypothetical protein
MGNKMAEWRNKTKQALTAKMSDSAIDFTVRAFALFKAIEDTATNNEPYAVLNATQDVLTGFVGNKFFEKNSSRLYTIIMAAYVQFSDAAQNAPTDTNDTKALVRFSQGMQAYKEIAATAALLDGYDAQEVRIALMDI